MVHRFQLDVGDVEVANPVALAADSGGFGGRIVFGRQTCVLIKKRISCDSRVERLDRK
jgi:hypothetical protein